MMDYIWIYMDFYGLYWIQSVKKYGFLIGLMMAWMWTSLDLALEKVQNRPIVVFWIYDGLRWHTMEQYVYWNHDGSSMDF